MITGSAPLSEKVLTFVRAALGCVVVEGYGQTECVAACTVSVSPVSAYYFCPSHRTHSSQVSMEGDSNAGHVGMTIPSASIKLVDVPELNYFASDGAGEVGLSGNLLLGANTGIESYAKLVCENC